MHAIWAARVEGSRRRRGGVYCLPTKCPDSRASNDTATARRAVGGTEGYGIIRSRRPAHSGLMPAHFTTLAHFPVSSAMSLPNAAGEPASASPPMSANRDFIMGSVRAALISLLSLSTISAGVFLGAPMPYHWLAS